MKNYLKHLNYRQISGLIRKDVLVRLRQPWMTLLQYLWPVAIFCSLYVLRLRFQPKDIETCQFPTRQLPSNDLLPFFQSYICSIENRCSSVDKYEEIADFQEVPVTSLLNIVQTFLNEKSLYDVVVNLPESKAFLPLVTTIATHSKFKYIESNAEYLVKHIPSFNKMIGGHFDIKKLFSEGRTFAKAGNLLCGHPFPRSNNIRFVNNILWSEDFNGADDDELNAMPTKYCKQLYLDVTNNNHGKITWKIIKPIIQGKILYGPENNETNEIMKEANKTFDDMRRTREFFKAIDLSIKLLRTDDEFKKNFHSLLSLAKSPIVASLVGDSFDIDMIEGVLNTILNDTIVSDIIGTIGNILDCFSTDRFQAVQSEKELEEVAYELGKKKLFYAGIYFNHDEKKPNEIAYKLRMEADNTPVTVENRNRFWFPGPEGDFELDMRYHRGYVEIQNSIDVAIIKVKKRQQYSGNETEEDEDGVVPTKDDDDDGFGDFDSDFGKFDDDDKFDENNETTTKASSIDFGDIFKAFGSSLNLSGGAITTFSGDKADDDGFWDFDDDTKSPATTTTPPATVLSRKKRQLDNILSMFFGGGAATTKSTKKNQVEYKVDDMKFFTKQFPYPKYTRDHFKKGLYLAQAVQMSFFVALIIQISSSVRQKIWFKESGNLSLMRTMGLKESSETISWIITSFIELAIVFFLALIILFSGGILASSNSILLFCYLLIFGMCIISFCFMASSFFSTASIGSVSTVILFLMTFLPYIIIISLGAVLSMFGKFFASLSLSTAFCYAWHYILRNELQHKEFSFSTAFSGDLKDNDFKFGVIMIIFDMFLYAAIGLIYQSYTKNDFNFHKVERQNIDKNFGAQMKKVTKVYEGSNPNKPAVDNVSISFKKDEILCLLGRNGAGKSTIIKMLTGQLVASSGEVLLPLDYDVITGFKNYQDTIGLCPQNNVLIPNLTAEEHLELYAQLKLRKGHDSEIRRILDNMKLGKYKNYRVSELSGGYKRRLCIAIAFLGSPNLVILDEPCSGVDTNARKNIWELIESLRKGRAVVLATHDLDEAQHLGDNIIIMKDGKIALESTTKNLHNELTASFLLNVNFKTSVMNDKDVLNDIKDLVQKNASIGPESFSVFDYQMSAAIPYFGGDGKSSDFSNLFKSLEDYQSDNKILDFNVISKNLDDLFKSVEDELPTINGNNGHNNNNMENVDLRKTVNGLQNHENDEKETRSEPTSFFATIGYLFWKRLLHFSRNYRLMICILVLPVIFEIIAMGFMKIRPPGDYDNAIEFNRNLYPNSIEVYSQENVNPFSASVYDEFADSCKTGKNCETFNSSLDAFKWSLETTNKYVEKRYGGVSINQSKSVVWYNNKGYHAMPLYLNLLNSAVLKSEMNDSSYNIKITNHPLKLGEEELSVSSILQQVADSGISLILLVSFSLVISGASVYIVNERVSGEKLQQKLCGVSFKTYWGVAFIWDYVVYCIAIAFAVIVFKFYAIPIYNERDNLLGIVVLLFLYGFASIPAVHLFEKLFNEASFANMSIFCLNVIIALSTLTTIIIMDVLSSSEEDDERRNLFNRIFLIFPQHALSDGLIEICKNHIMSKIFIRYYINTYQSPVTSDLLKPHFRALIILGVVFTVLNYIIESGIIWKIFKEKPKRLNHELKVVTIQNSIKNDRKTISHMDYALKVENLYKSYSGNNYAVNNVSFTVKNGECYGLLGANGAGKSTIFSILSGNTQRYSGLIDLSNSADNKFGISYCPQTNALDMLLTVEEVIRFYGKLRNVRDLNALTETTLESFHLAPYKKILVKNLSGGNRRKLSVACAAFGNTNLVLMDEPTSDMDPLTRSLVYKTIRELNDNNCSVILTSHSVSEIEELCHSIGILVDGTMKASGAPDMLKRKFGNRYVITIFNEKAMDLKFEEELRMNFPTLENLMCHHYSAQFIIHVKNTNNVIEKDDNRVLFSDLLKQLNSFTIDKDFKYTLSECLLDQVYDNIIKTGLTGFDNIAFVQNENHMT